jgi:phosphoribosylformylglycinamidine cyclo-ligase
MHADGAGTKSILAYLYWKETGDTSVWKGIAKDAIIMNLDDLLCAGIYDNILFSSTIDRNKKLIPGEVLEAIIDGSRELFEELDKYGIRIHYLGGETADVGDVVRTIAVNGTMSARWPSDKIVSNEKITAGDVIVGLDSFGQANYETEYNSGIGSNGLTSARHDLLSPYYRSFGETYDPTLEEQVAYIGKHRLTDSMEIEGKSLNVGRLVLSPTRTYAPFVRALLTTSLDRVHGMIHCSGGGQTKCMKYLPDNFRIIKDNMVEPPPVFNLIREAGGNDDREMYQVFNMGCRLEIFCEEKDADHIIGIAEGFGIKGRITGRVEPNAKKELILQTGTAEITYSY